MSATVSQFEGSTSAIILGCTVAVVSSAIQSLGITLQRKSHLMTHSNLPNHHHHQKYKRNMWLFGFCLFIVANIFGSLIQITTLPLIILSPLQSIGLIFNSILSCLLLPGEKFTQKLGWGTIIISIGAFIIAYQGGVEPNESPDRENFDKVLSQLLRKSFICWFIATFLLIGILLLVNYFISKRRMFLKQKRDFSTQLNLSRMNLKYQRILNRYQFLKGVNYGIISGTLTAHTFLFAKSLIDVIIAAILDSQHKSLHKLFTTANLTPYLLLVIMLMIICCQLTAFNLGLSQILTGILYPLCFLVYNLMNLINDLTFNSLISDGKMSLSQLGWVIIGLSGVLFGVVLISWDSAFGKDTMSGKLQFQSNSDEILLHLKFPYTNNNETILTTTDQPYCDEPIPINASASVSLETMNDSTIPELPSSLCGSPESRTSLDINKSRNHTFVGPKRILSFEQNQLLNLLDI